MRWILLHSPLTGPLAWRAVAAEATRLGVEVTTPTLPTLSELKSPYYPALGEAVAAQVAGEGRAALVVHSGGGGLAAQVVAATGDRIAQVVFVDALPRNADPATNPGRHDLQRWRLDRRHVEPQHGHHLGAARSRLPQLCEPSRQRHR